MTPCFPHLCSRTRKELTLLILRIQVCDDVCWEPLEMNTPITHFFLSFFEFESVGVKSNQEF